MKIDDDLFRNWAIIRNRIATALFFGQTETDSYREDCLRNAEYLSVVNAALPYHESHQRLLVALELLKSDPPRGPSPQPVGSDTTSGLPMSQTDRTMRVIEALRKIGSPLQAISSLVNDRKVNWADDTRNWTKAFLFACLSELVYLKMSRNEVPGKDRYKVIPSSTLRQLLENKIHIEAEQLFRGSEIDSATGDTASVVFGTFTFPDFVVIAVRGTMPRLNDWLLDVDVRRVVREGRRYHAGFYLDVENALTNIVATVPSDSKPLYFTGHSMGAAIAGILSQVWRGPQRRMTPYTFASPRFGDASVARFPVYSHVRAFDPVPHLPPRHWGFRSSGWPPAVLPGTDQWLPGWKLMRNWRSLIPAHHMEIYRQLVGQEYGGRYFPSNVYSQALTDALVDDSR